MSNWTQIKKINGVDVTYVVIDPKVDTVYAAHQYGATVEGLRKREKADLAINFNYANTVTGVPVGRLIVDGVEVIRDIPKTVPREELFMTKSGTLGIGSKPRTPLLWAMQGSPRLLKDSKDVITESIKRDQLGSDIWQSKAYRTAAGITAAGKLIIVRTYTKILLPELASIMLQLGCVQALNGDGGGSSYLSPVDTGWGRKLGSALIANKGVEKEMGKPKLIIDPGHGGTDPGAGDNGIIEKEYTLKISLYQFERFKELGVNVALTRDNDRSLDSVQRTNIVKDSGAKYCISNHINAAASTEAAGAEIIQSIHNDGKLAHAIAYALRDAGQILRKTPVFSKANDNGGDYYFMQRLTGSVTTLIVEYGFCSNAADAKRVKDNWMELAEATIKAFCSFIGHPYTKPAVPVITPPVTPPKPPVIVIDGFTDIAGHWALSSIRKAIKSGKMNGVSPDLFDPDAPLTRAQAAVLMDRNGHLE